MADPFDPGRVVMKEGRLVSLMNFSVSDPVQSVRTDGRDEKLETIQKSWQPSTPDRLQSRVLPPEPVKGDEADSKPDLQTNVDSMDTSGVIRSKETSIRVLKCAAPDPLQLRILPPVPTEGDKVENNLNSQIGVELRDPSEAMKWNGSNGMRKNILNLKCSAPDPLQAVKRGQWGSDVKTDEKSCLPSAQDQSSDPITKHETSDVEFLLSNVEPSDPTAVVKRGEMRESVPDALQVSKKCSSENVSESWRPPTEDHLQMTQQSELAAIGETPRMEEVLVNIKSNGARHMIKQEGTATRLTKCPTRSVQEISDDEDNVETEEIFSSPTPEHFENNMSSCSPGEAAKDLNEPMNVPPCTPSEVIKREGTETVPKCSTPNPQVIIRDLNASDLEGVEKSYPPTTLDLLMRTQLSDPTVRDETESKQDLQTSVTASDPAEVIKSSFPDVFQVVTSDGSETVTVEKSFESSKKEHVQIVTEQSEPIGRDRTMHVTGLPMNVLSSDPNEIIKKEETSSALQKTFPGPVQDVMVHQNLGISVTKECSPLENLHSVGSLGCNPVIEDQKDLEMSVETCDSNEAVSVDSTVTSLPEPAWNSRKANKSDSIETTEQNLCKPPVQDWMQLKAGWSTGGQVPDNVRQDLAMNMKQDPGMKAGQDHLGMNVRQAHPTGMNLRPDLGMNMGQNLGMNIRQDHVMNMRQDLRLNMRPDLWMNMRQVHPGINVRQGYPGMIVRQVDPGMNARHALGMNVRQDFRINMRPDFGVNVRQVQPGMNVRLDHLGMGIRQAHPGMNMRQDLGMNIRQNLWMNVRQVQPGMNVRLDLLGMGIRQAHPEMSLRQDLGMNIRQNLGMNVRQAYSGMNIRQDLNVNMNPFTQSGIINGTANMTCVVAQSLPGSAIGMSGNGSQYLWTQGGLVNQLPVQTTTTAFAQPSEQSEALNASIQRGGGMMNPVQCSTVQNVRHLGNSLLSSANGKTMRKLIDERRMSHRGHINRGNVTEGSQSDQSRGHLKRACKEKTVARCRENLASMEMEEVNSQDSLDSSYKDSEDSDDDTSDYKAQAGCENSSPNDTVTGSGNGSNDADPGPVQDIKVQENQASSETKDRITRGNQENLCNVGSKTVTEGQEDLEMSVETCDSSQARSVESAVTSHPEQTLNTVRPDLGMNVRQTPLVMNARHTDPGMKARQDLGVKVRQDNLGMNVRPDLGTGARQGLGMNDIQDNLGTNVRQDLGMEARQDLGMNIRQDLGMNIRQDLNVNMNPFTQSGILNGTANTTCVVTQSVPGSAIGMSGSGSQYLWTQGGLVHHLPVQTTAFTQSNAAESNNGSSALNASIQRGGGLMRPVQCSTVQNVRTDGHLGNSLLNSANGKTMRELIDERRMSHQGHINRENVTEGPQSEQSRGHLKRACKEKTGARCRENLASLDLEEEKSQDSSYVDSDDDASVYEALADCEKSSPSDAVPANEKCSPNELGQGYENEVPYSSKAMNITTSTSTNISTYSVTDTSATVIPGVPIKCSHCERTFENAIGLRAHIVHRHPDVGLFKCKYCGKGCSDFVTLKRHTYRHTGRYPFNCDVCGKGFSRKQNLVIHVRIKHTGEKPFKCDKCEMAFARKSSLTSHLKSHNAEKPYLCKFCGKAYKRWIDLNQHEHTHGEKNFKCKVCKKLFYTKKKMDDHRFLSHNVGYICDICGKRLASKKAFKTHMITHSDERPFKCPNCEKAFKTQHYYQVHARIHANVRPFSCKTCGEAFTQYNALVRHKNTHSGAKPFTCNLCGKSFTQTNSLVRHKRIHTGERPFKCDICGKSYIERYPLTVHMKTHEEQ